MRPFSVFSAKGKWFKGNCHTHTTLSDGACSPSEVSAHYRKKGYDFLVLTDHRAVQPEVSSLQRKDFLVLNGVELHTPTTARSCVKHHLVCIGLEEVPDMEKNAPWEMKSLIRWVWRHGGLPIYGHPYWCGHDIGHMEEGRTAFGMEAFNTVCHAMRGLGHSSAHLDQALSRGFRWRVFAVDDTHATDRDCGGGWIMLKAPRLTRATVMNALRKGRFYASCGPEIHAIAIRRGAVHVECSPVKSIVLHAEGPKGISMAAKKKLLTRGVFRLPASSRYARIEIIDAKGRKAWTNPVYLHKKTGRWLDE